MRDTIKIKNLETFANHGVFPEENKLGQKFVVSADLYTNTRNAGLHDNLVESIHYGEVSHEINRFMSEYTFKLIESVAENLAAHLLFTFPLLEGVKISVKKPWAPIQLPLDYASVEIERFWHRGYIALGSNVGNTDEYIQAAIEAVNNKKDCTVVKVSELIRTKPYGGVEQDDFLNGCMEIRTLQTPHELLKTLNEIEKEAGRERIVRWGPRTLDLDILLYDEEIVQSDDLMIPHIDMKNRDFVLGPLAEIAPYAIHPVYKKSIMEMKEELEK